MLDAKIKTFLTVCETMNYTKAAEKLYITQPAVSAQIRLLEDEYGGPLFRYADRRLYLTERGRLLRQQALTIRHDDEILRRRMNESEGKRRLIRCGATMTAGPYAAVKYLSRFLMTDDETNVKMIIASTQTLLASIDEGSIDFALIEGYFPRSEYDSIVCSSERFSAYVSPEYRFRRDNIKHLGDLVEERLLIREKGSGTRELLEYCLKNRDLTIEDFPCRAEVNSIEMLKALAEECCGIAFMYDIAARVETEEGRLVKLALPGASTRHDFSLVYRKGSGYAAEYRKAFARRQQ